MFQLIHDVSKSGRYVVQERKHDDVKDIPGNVPFVDSFHDIDRDPDTAEILSHAARDEFSPWFRQDLDRVILPVVKKSVLRCMSTERLVGDADCH